LELSCGHNIGGRGDRDSGRLGDWLADSVVNGADVVRSGGSAGCVCRCLGHGDLLRLLSDSGSPRASLPGGGTVGVHAKLC